MRDSVRGSDYRQGPRIAVIAYACTPFGGSEPGVGWEWTRAISSVSVATVFTRDDLSTTEIETSLADVGANATVVRVPTLLDRYANRPWSAYPRYFLWLVAARRAIRRAHKDTRFDLVHHVTYASDWLPTVNLNRVPTVWGPVGGATQPPRELLGYLSRTGRYKSRLRGLIGSTCRRTIALRTVRGSAVCIALNTDTAKVLGRMNAKLVVTRPNAVVEIEPFLLQRSDGTLGSPRDQRLRVAIAGRVLDWKGHRIALDALATSNGSWELHVYGDGPDLTSLKAEFSDLISSGLVSFHGKVDRNVLLMNFATYVDVLLFPSLHDSAPWVVAEAAGFGIPVFCFETGGAPNLAGACARLIDAHKPAESINALLAQVDPTRRTDSETDWSRRSLHSFLNETYEIATDSRAPKAQQLDGD